MKKKLYISSLFTFFTRGFGASAAFILNLFVSKNADINEAGLFFYSIAFIYFLGSLITFGSPISILKTVGANISNNSSLVNNDISFVVKLVTFIGFILLTMTLIFSERIGELLGVDGLYHLLPFIVIGIILFALIEIVSHAIQGMHRSVTASLVQNVITPLSFILLLFIFHLFDNNLNSKNLLILYVFCSLGALLIGIYVWCKCSNAKFLIKSALRPELKASMTSLFIMVIMTQSVQWAGQFATGNYLLTSDIAVFSSAQRTAMLASFVLIAINLVVAPKFANAFALNNLKEVNNLSKLSSILMVGMATPVVIFMLVFPEFIMGLFGDKYIVAAPLLQIMAVGQFINVITGSVGYILNMTGHEKDFRNVVLFSGPISVILAFALTKEFGLIGAAYATAIALAIQNLLAVVMVKKRLGFNTLNIFRKIA